ncbi:MAG: M20/M25/M40 family metallo-hydrolase [Candidatus Hodarchaeales archaeon]|jgi:acetylornithine deacetylase/succinyl-diaminopimelate desuccinylase-like protein
MVAEWWVKQIKQDFESKHLPAIQEYLRIPSISATGEGMQETAEATAAALDQLGATDVQIAPTNGWPVVYGELIDDPEKLTVLFYSMYDVQPVEPEKWMVPPFNAEIAENFEGMGQALVARGVVNTKGPTMAFFQALQAVKRTGKDFPVNVIFAIEGEEELGSRHFPDFVESFKPSLSQADVAYFPFFSETVSGRVSIYLGCRGIIYFKIKITGGDWGGPRSRNIHSSLASTVDSPTWRLVALLSKMRARDGRILIPGIYDKVKPLSKEDEQLLDALVRDFDPDESKAMNDVHRFINDDAGNELTGKELLEKLYSPCLTIDGIISGFTEEEGTKTVLPHYAYANMDIRLAPDMTVEDTRAKLRDYIQREAPEAELEMELGYRWSKMSPSHPYVKAHMEILTAGKQSVTWPMLSGSAPFYIFQEKFNMPFIVGGLGHGARVHSPNEYAFLNSNTGAGGIIDFELSVAKMLTKLAEVGKLK